MATVTLTITDTSTGGVSIKTVFDPCIDALCSPAQSLALSMLSDACKRLGSLPQPSDTQSIPSDARTDSYPAPIRSPS